MKPTLTLKPGSDVCFRGSRYAIESCIGFDAVIARNLTTGEPERLLIRELSIWPPPDSAITTTELAAQTKEDWQTARQRRDLIKPLLERGRLPKSEMDILCAQAGVHRTTIQRWTRRYQASGRLSVLQPTLRNGGRGKSRLEPDIDAIVSLTIKDYFLPDQKRTKKDTVLEVIRRCKNANKTPPHPNTIYNRLRNVTKKKLLQQAGHSKAASERFDPRVGTYDEAQSPLAVVQMDHADLDIYVVDHTSHRPIGRPTITTAIDVYSRMILGFYLSLEDAGATATGQCLVHAAFPKEVWLAGHGITGDWPCWGFPRKIHVDNAKDFRGTMLERACDQYEIDIDFRPVRQPRFGGYIERFYGTLQKQLHKLDGTTFSSPSQRGDYDPKKSAKYTLTDLEGIIGQWIVNVYHRSLHKGINTSPYDLWNRGIFEGDDKRPATGLPERPTDLEQISLDFMPFQTRTVQPDYGVQWDKIHYYHDVLRPYIGTDQSYIVKRDPRDISAIFFYHPESKTYSKIPYRNIAYPPISIWEYKAVERQLINEGREHIDEAAIFRAYEEIERRARNAAKETTRVRRSRERRIAAVAALPSQIKEKEPVQESRPPLRRFAHVKAFEVEVLE